MRHLPPQPSLEYLKKEAKELLRRLRRGESVDERIRRWLPSMESDGDPVRRFTLHQVQHALALSYGFTSWPALKTYTDAASGLVPLGDFPPEALAQWQELVDTLALAFEVPLALLRRVDGNEIETIVASEDGAPTPAGQRVRLAGEHCERVVRERAALEIDGVAQRDVATDGAFVSYLGYPVLFPWGEVSGTLCVLDRRPHDYTPSQKGVLGQLVRLVEAQLALWHQRTLLSWRNKQLLSLFDGQSTQELARICSVCRQVAHQDDWVSIEEFMGHHGQLFKHGICPTCFDAHCHEDVRQ